MLYCNTATVATTRHAPSEQAGVRGAPEQALQAAGGAGAGRSGRAGVQSERRQAGAGHAGRARPGRWAHGLGERAGHGCALGALRLVFNLVFRLGIFPESLNEHCSL